jgi:phospho-N-acetylmuramoyl-pentapeptide-transferase
MEQILVALAFACVLCGCATPYFASWLLRLGIGSQERVDGVQAHLVKQGTPTLGGVVVIAATTVAYGVTHVRLGPHGVHLARPSIAGLLTLAAMWALGAVGGVDDLISATRRRSLGLSPAAKTIAQAFIAVAIALVALRYGDTASAISWSGHDVLTLPRAAFVVLVFVLVWVMANSVNISDGLDGLSSGSGAMTLFVYVVISYWEWRHPQIYGLHPTRGLLDLAVMAAALLGACIGFLWWNAPPAKIFIGDAGAMAIGGALVVLAVETRTQLLLPIICTLFITLYASSLIQIVVFKLTKRFWPHPNGGGRRVFKMAPLHLHFELMGWPEITVTIRLWLVAAVFAGLGLAIFYVAFIHVGGIG